MKVIFYFSPTSQWKYKTHCFFVSCHPQTVQVSFHCFFSCKCEIVQFWTVVCRQSRKHCCASYLGRIVLQPLVKRHPLYGPLKEEGLFYPYVWLICLQEDKHSVPPRFKKPGVESYTFRNLQASNSILQWWNNSILGCICTSAATTFPFFSWNHWTTSGISCHFGLQGIKKNWRNGVTTTEG